MRLLTWNLCRGSLHSKGHAVVSLGFDVAVLQEVSKPHEQAGHVLWFGRNPRLGMAVLSSDQYILRELPRSEDIPELVVPIDVRGPRNFILLAVWTLRQKHFRYIRAASKAIDHYSSFFDSGPVVMLGDFNANKIWDSHHPPDLNFSSMVTRLQQRGLVSAYHHHRTQAFGSETDATFYLQWNQSKPYHIDYCFLPRTWADDIVRVEVGDFEQWKTVSDHRPLLVELRSEA
jgi:exodeoxyribonuclease III